MNKQIVVAAFIITGSGVVKVWLADNPHGTTKVVLGGYIFLLVLSLLDMAGGDLSKIASGLAMVAVVYTLLSDLSIFEYLTKLVSKGA